jgi:hypothetical protein
MIRYPVGQYLKPKEPNMFWRAFEIVYMYKQDSTLKYDVKCYGHNFDGATMTREIIMCHLALEDSSEKITEESFKNIMNGEKV